MRGFRMPRIELSGQFQMESDTPSVVRWEPPPPNFSLDYLILQGDDPRIVLVLQVANRPDRSRSIYSAEFSDAQSSSPL
jgi:hypothetical protein